MAKAVFLDRDGVLNQLVYNPSTKRYESPHFVKDFALIATTPEALKKLQARGYLLFLVSNQPSYALGKTSLENIQDIHTQFENELEAAGVTFTEFYYCYHHPDGVIEAFSGPCECRKPEPHFILHAIEHYQLDAGQSWFVGDQDTDILCGQGADLRTILIENPHSGHKRGASKPDYLVDTLVDAVRIILDSPEA